MPAGRPRTYDASWTRRGQRWPADLLRRLDDAAKRMGTGREQLVVAICETWCDEYDEKRGPQPHQGELI